VCVTVTVSKTRGRQAHVEIRNAKYKNFMPLRRRDVSKRLMSAGAREAVKLVGDWSDGERNYHSHGLSRGDSNRRVWSVGATRYGTNKMQKLRVRCCEKSCGELGENVSLRA